MSCSRLTLVACAVAAALGVPPAGGRHVAAQQPDPQEAPSGGIVRKNRVPVSNEILKVQVPAAAEADLPNGLHLIVLEDHRLPQITLQLFIPGAGGYFDPADRPGLASFTAALMREGTISRTSNQISQELEVMAATLNVAAGPASPEATITGSCLSDQFEKLLDLAADLLLRPSFRQEEWARYRQRARATLMQQRANAGFLAAEMFARTVYGTHPAGRISPTPAALDGTERESLVEFHRAHYVPDRAALAIAGDISLSDARRLIEARLAAWRKSGAALPAVIDPQPIGAAKILFVARPNSVQTSLIVGTQAIERTSADYDVLSVMNKVIGGGPTGRLFIHLREQKGYTYGASSGLSATQHRGDWQAATNVRTGVTEPALRDLLAEIKQLRDVPVPDEELADAKRSMIASFGLSMESPAQLVGLHVTRWRYNLPLDYWDRYSERVMAVTRDQVQAAARKYLAADRLQVVAVGDPSTIAERLKQFGSVDTYDAEGRRAGL